MKNVSDIYPLSPIQELMLVHALSRSGTDLLFNQVVYTLKGDLDVAVYQRCWQDMVQRHSMLRTLFLWESLKAPVQVVRESAELDWQNLDWRNISVEEQEARLAKLLQEDQDRGFNLNQAPLMRFILCRRNDELYTLVWSSHHLIIDRWCIGILMSESAELYEARRKSLNAQLVSSHPFREYIHWLQRQGIKDAENFWRSELNGITNSTRLSDSAPILSESSFGELKNRINKQKTAALRRFAADHRLTLSTMIMGAWALLHALMTPARDLLLGVTISGRPTSLPGVESIVGPFINNVPLRVSYPLDQPVVNWLQTIQDRQQAIQTYGYISPLQIQEWSEMPDAISLFETLFLFQSPVKMPEISFQIQVESATLRTNFPLTLAVEEDANGLLFWTIYAHQIFSQEDNIKLLDQMRFAIDAIETQPDSNLSQLLEQLRTKFALIETDLPTSEVAQTEVTAKYKPPRNGLEARLFKLWENLLGHHAFGVQDDFFTLGGTSLMAMRMFARMADQYGVNLPLSLLFTETTIEALAARISEDGKLDESLSVLVPIQPLGSKPPFFCIHGVDGAVLGYRDLVNALGDDRPFLGFQAIGWDDQENFDSTIEAMASRYIDAMRTYQPQGPYRIGGYCFGGVVAYEMACQLEKLGEQVSLLAVFEGAMPEVKETSVSIPYRLSFFLKSIPNWIKDYAGMPPEQLMSRIHTTINRLWGKFLGNPEAQRRARAEEILDTDSNYIPDRNIELTNVNSDAFLMYKPDKYNGTVTVYRARNRSINEVLFGSLDPKMGWDDLAMGGVNVRIVDGFHRNLHLEPYVGSLAADLTQSLEGEQVRRVD